MTKESSLLAETIVSLDFSCLQVHDPISFPFIQDIMNCEKSYDSLPNFTAADCKLFSLCQSWESLFVTVADCSCTITRPRASRDECTLLTQNEVAQNYSD